MKKIISVFLAVVLLLGIFPLPTIEAVGEQPFAPQNASGWKQGEDSNGVYYETLNATGGELTYQSMLSASEGIDVTYDIQAVTFDTNCVNSCVWIRDSQTRAGFYARIRMTGDGQHQIRGQYYDGSNWSDLFSTGSWVSGSLPNQTLRVNIVLKDGQVKIVLSNRDGQVQGQYTSSAIPASFFESTQTKFYFETDNKGLYRLGNFYGLWERELPPTTVSNIWELDGNWLADSKDTKLILNEKTSSEDAVWKTPVDLTQAQTISMDWVTDTQIATNNTWGEQLAIKFQQPDSQDYLYIRLKRYRNDRGAYQMYLSTQYYLGGNWSRDVFDRWCDSNGKLNQIGIKIERNAEGLHIKLTDLENDKLLTDSLLNADEFNSADIKNAYTSVILAGTALQLKVNVPNENTAGYYLTNPVTEMPEDPEETLPEETEPDVTEPEATEPEETEPEATESQTSAYWELAEGWAVDAEDTKLILTGVSANEDAVWKTPLDMTASQQITMQWLTESEISSNSVWGEQLALKLTGSDSEDYLFIRVRRYHNDRGAYQIHLSAQYYYQNNWSRDVLDRWCDGANLLNQIGIQMTVHNGKIGIQLTDLISGTVLAESTLSAEQFPEGDIRDAVSAQIFYGTEVTLKIKALEGNTAPYTVTNPVTVPYEPEPEVEPVKSEVWELADGWTVDEADIMLLLTGKEAVSEAVWKQTLDMTQNYTLSMDWETNSAIETNSTWGEQMAIKLTQPDSADYLYIRLKRYRNDKNVEQVYVTAQYYCGGQWSENVVAQWGTKSNKKPLQHMTLQLTRQTAENNLRIKVVDKDTGESLVSNAFTASNFKNSAVGAAFGSAVLDGTAVILKIDSTKENTASYYLTDPVVGQAQMEPKTFTDYGWHNDNDNFTGWTLINGQSFRVSKNRVVTDRVWKEVVSNQKTFGISADITINKDSSVFVKVKGARFELDSRNGDGDQVYLKINNKGSDWIAATDGQVNIKLVRQNGGDLQVMITGKDNPEPVVFTMALTEPDNRNFEVGIYAGSATFRNIRESSAKLDIETKTTSAYWELGDGWAVNMADTELMLTKADTGTQAQWKQKLNLLQNQNLTLTWKPETKAEVQQVGFTLKAANSDDYLLITLKRTADASGSVQLESGAQYFCGGVWSEQVIGNKMQTGEGEITLKLTVDGQKGSLQVQLLDANNQQVSSDRVLTADMFADMNTGIAYRDTITKSNSVIFGVAAPAGNLSAYRLTNPVIQTVSAEQPEETQPEETNAPAMFGWENYKNDFTGWSFVSEQEFSAVKDEVLYNYVSKKLVENQEKFKISLDVALDAASCAYVKLKGVGFELDNRNGGITVKPDGQEKMSLGASDGTLQIVLYRYDGDIQVTVTGKDSGKTLSFAMKVGSAAGDKLNLGIYAGKVSFRSITGTNDVTPHAGGEKSGSDLVKLLTVTAAASLTVMAAIIVILLIKRKKAKKA